MSRFSMLALATALAVGSLTGVSDAWARGPGGHVSRGPSGVRTFSAAPRVSGVHTFSGVRTFSAAPRFSGVRTFSGVRNFGVVRGVPRRFGLHRRFRFIGPYPYLAYNSCYRWRTIWTNFGPRTVRVNVCGYPYAYRYGYPFVY